MTALRTIESSALASIFLLALAGNIWGICLLVRSRQRLSAANCLVLNLFCADLLFITAIPFIAVVRWTESWVLGDVVCHMLFYVVSLSGTVVILSLSAVSLERVVSIARLRHAAFRRRKELAAALLLIWGFAALATLPLCCFFTVVRLPDAAGEVRANAAGEGPQERGSVRPGAPGQSGEAGAGPGGDGGSSASVAGGRRLLRSGQVPRVCLEQRPELPRQGSPDTRGRCRQRRRPALPAGPLVRSAGIFFAFPGAARKSPFQRSSPLPRGRHPGRAE